MEISVKYFGVVTLLFMTGSQSLLFGQYEGRGPGSWSEPLFQDNIADFNASPGDFEFSVCYSASPGKFNWVPELGWEMEASLSKSVGIESGFYSTGFMPGKEASENATTRAAFSIQYTFVQKKEKAWAAGADFLSPGWSGNETSGISGWNVNPFLLYGRKWPGYLNAQFRFSPSFEIAYGKLQTEGYVQGSLFWEKDGFGIGMELGTAVEDDSVVIYAAPQAGASLGAFSLWAGWWGPILAPGRVQGLVLLCLSYAWVK